MGYHALNILEIWDRMAHVIVERYTHVHCVCGGSEPEYTSDRKDIILGPRLEGGGVDNNFLVLFKGEQKIFIAAYGEQLF